MMINSTPRKSSADIARKRQLRDLCAGRPVQLPKSAPSNVRPVSNSWRDIYVASH